MTANTTKSPDKENHVDLTDVGTVKYRGQVFGVGAIAEWRRWASIAVMLDALFDSGKSDGIEVDGITIKLDVKEKGVLLVARGTRRKQRVVGFHRGSSPADAMEGFAIRRAKGSVDWRDDKPLERAIEPGDDREPLSARPGL